MTPLCQCCKARSAERLTLNSDGVLLLCRRCHAGMELRRLLMESKDAQLRYLEGAYAAPAAGVDR